MKRSVKIRVLCLLMAAVVLGGAMTVSAVMGSPYEVLKNALFDALTERNATIELEVSLLFNGEVVEKTTSKNIQGDSSSLGFDRSSRITSSDGFVFSTDSLTIMPFLHSDFRDSGWHSATVHPPGMGRFGGGATNLFTSEDRNSTRMRFTELMLDLVVGDLRNNMTMTSEGGIRHIRGILTENQVPEIVRVGIDVLIEQSSSSPTSTFEGWEPWEIPMTSLILNQVVGDAHVDADGNLLYLNGRADFTAVNVTGHEFELGANLVMRVSDIGTSNPESPIPGAEAILTQDMLRARFGSDMRMTVFFRLNEDGTIDEDSITTTHPMESWSTHPRLSGFRTTSTSASVTIVELCEDTDIAVLIEPSYEQTITLTDDEE